MCGSHVQGCEYLTSTMESRPCPNHPKVPLVSSGECPVEFLYIKPTDATDNRRWLTGFVRGSREVMEKANIHNHPTHPSSKIPCKIQNDIRDAVTENPHLKTSDFVEGRGMGYIPSAVSLAAANKGKIKHIRNSALRQSSVPSIACILDFEKQATKHDRQMKSTAGNHEAEHMDEYQKCGRPYLLHHHLTPALTYVIIMSPWMAEKFSCADFIEPDITFGVSVDLPYLLNIVTFDYSTCKWIVVARALTNRITQEAYEHIFRRMFEGVQSRHSAFKTGVSLRGIVVDWSDTQRSALGAVLSEEIAASLCKGCKVHYMRSVKRMAKRVGGATSSRQAFECIAYHIPKMATKEAVETLFDVLRGTKTIQDAATLIPSQKVLQEIPSNGNKYWLIAKAWSEWWRRPKHLAMLSPVYATMDSDRFSFLPDTTNAVEAYNRVSKSGKAPEPLAVTLMSLYKKDMVVVLEGLADNAGISTTYVDRTPAAREKRNKRSNDARKKRQAKDKDDAQGPPDRNSDFKKPKTLKPKVNTEKDAGLKSCEKKKQSKRKAPEDNQMGGKRLKLTTGDPDEDNDGSFHLDAHSNLPEPSTPSTSHNIIDLDLVPTPPSRSLWLPELELFLEDKEIILSDKWLMQQRIYAVQVLLHQKFPKQTGLQDTLDLANMCWNSRPDNFIQIVNISNSHWVCVSNINCPPAVVDVYDSMYPSPSYTLKEQVSTILRSTEKITLRMVNVQHQNGGTDCGLFAISAAVSLCHGEDPASHLKNQSLMRNHLVSCLENHDMVVFPDSTMKPVRSKRRIKSEYTVPVYCKCRLPWSKDSKLGNMAQCKRCKQWYHQQCANISSLVFSDHSTKWFCESCSV